MRTPKAGSTRSRSPAALAKGRHSSAQTVRDPARPVSSVAPAPLPGRPQGLESPALRVLRNASATHALRTEARLPWLVKSPLEPTAAGLQDESARTVRPAEASDFGSTPVRPRSRSGQPGSRPLSEAFR